MNEIITFFTGYWLQILISAAAAYLISSVNTSIIVTRIVLHKDIRTLGSGNAGFTNVLRCVGKAPAIITFVGDFLKGVVSVGIAYLLMWGASDKNAELYRAYLMYLAGLFAVIGHSFPIYYKFKGGKGVVTTASVMLLSDWRALVIALLIFIIMFTITKIISLCAITNAAIYPISTITLKLLDCNGITTGISPFPNATVPFAFFAFAIALLTALLVIVRHKDNIKRLLDGTEKKITAKK